MLCVAAWWTSWLFQVVWLAGVRAGLWPRIPCWYGQEVVGAVITHTGSAHAAEVDAALAVLLSLAADVAARLNSRLGLSCAHS